MPSLVHLGVLIIMTEMLMSGPYLIFKRNEADKLSFVEVVQDFDLIEPRLTHLTGTERGSYLIYDPSNARFEGPFEQSA
jgi:hypothetical protein